MSRYAPLFLALLLGFCSLLAAQTPPEKPNPVPKSRSFLFTYRATVTGLPPGNVARIWLPIPPSNEDQAVQIVSKHLPAEGQIAREPKFGNQILYVEAKAGPDGTIPLELTYQVTRREVRSDRTAASKEPEKLALDLEPNAKVPDQRQAPGANQGSDTAHGPARAARASL